MAEELILEEYSYDAGGIPVSIKISRKPKDYVPSYTISIPLLAEGTKIMLDALKGELITKVKLDVAELLDPKQAQKVKEKFEERAIELLSKHFIGLPEDKKKILVSYMLQHTLGLGELELLMADENLEDIAINNATEPIWVYHKRLGWCKTNLLIKKEEVIYEYAAMAGRKVGRQINVLNPVMNAHLPSGDRINATLAPISSHGNTISIRKFAKNPWTVPFLVEVKTISEELAALIWLCVQNEISIISSGGAGSGKTSFLNAICCMIPPNQRIVTIEDTRELSLPNFFQWVAMVTRDPNPEGKGGVEMLDLMVNSLRQRPDRIIVGEVRRQREAEVLFEAIHTGHSVYATMHADNAAECVTRLTSPPINLPKTVLSALGGIVIQFRNRRTGIRRTFEFAEITKDGEANSLYRWNPREDIIEEVGKMASLNGLLSMYTGMTEKEIKEDVDEKRKILKWMIGKKYYDINVVGKIVADYYLNSSEVMDAAKKNKEWDVSL